MRGGEHGSRGHDREPHAVPGSGTGQHAEQGRAAPLPESNLHSSADFLNDQLKELGQANLFFMC